MTSSRLIAPCEGRILSSISLSAHYYQSIIMEMLAQIILVALQVPEWIRQYQNLWHGQASRKHPLLRRSHWTS
jgi:hypothetical protein